jgi:hypothetical protein
VSTIFYPVHAVKFDPWWFFVERLTRSTSATVGVVVGSRVARLLNTTCHAALADCVRTALAFWLPMSRMIRAMQAKTAPESCPRCRGSRVVRILWRYFELSDDDAAAVAEGRALLGLDAHYFTSANPRLLAIGTLVFEESLLPQWVCLDCFPQWLDVDRMARAEEKLGSQVCWACYERDFARAAEIRDQRCKLQAGHQPKYERLLRDLLGKC